MKFKYILPVLLLLPSLAIAQSFPETAAFVEREFNRVGIPGLSYAITKGDQIVMSGGLGVRSLDTGVPVDADTLFHIGSTNKSLTAFLIARLNEARVLSWRNRIRDVLPAFEFEDFAVPRIKIKQLLNMTSGILDFSEDDFFEAYGEQATPEQVMQFMQSYEIPELPGREFSYSNLSASLAGYLAVYAAGGNTSDLNRGYADLLQHWVLDPLGMTDSTIYVSEARATDNYSVSHEKSGGVSRVAASYDRDDDCFAPAGSLKSSANDMARYIMALATKGRTFSGERVLGKRSVRRLFKASKVSRASSDDYALGWDRRTMSNTLIMTHEGAWDNFTSVIALSPRHKAGLVVLVNTEATGNLLSGVVESFAADLAK